MLSCRGATWRARPETDWTAGTDVVQISGVPFYANTPDDGRCFQAALRMVLGYYLPTRRYTWAELDAVTAHKDKSTWPMTGVLHCLSLGFQVTWIDPFDLKRFSREGYAYMLEVYGREVTDNQMIQSNVVQEMRYAGQLAAKITAETRVPTRRDLESCLARGRVVICNVNARTMNGQLGYMGHFVVVIGIDEAGVRLHDPGLPPSENRFVDWQTFDRAWSHPDERYRNVVALWLPADATGVDENAGAFSAADRA